MQALARAPLATAALAPTLPSPVTTITQIAPSPTTILSVTTTTTSSTTATVTADSTYVDNIPCGQTWSAPDIGTLYNVVCGAVGSDQAQLVSQAVVGDWDVCVKMADDYPSSDSFSFRLSTSICNIYTNYVSNSGTTANSDYVYAYYHA
jgi:hypothetical protein